MNNSRKPATEVPKIPRIKLSDKIVMLGMGAVAQNLLSIFLRYVEMDFKKLVIIEMEDMNCDEVAQAKKRGATLVRQKIAPGNYANLLSKYVDQETIIVDLTWNISTMALIEFCYKNGVRYVNTSVEVWNPYDRKDDDLQGQTLYHRQMNIAALVKKLERKAGKKPTVILDHGANPGLVSHFLKRAILAVHKKKTGLTVKSSHNPNWNQLAELSRIRTIHISERDSQIDTSLHDPNTFANTWSVEGIMEEGTAPAELGWGTHETNFPTNGLEHKSGPKNQILLRSKGFETKCRSFVPSGPIDGYIIRHGEAFSISDYYTVRNGSKIRYRPTVHYAYKPCEQAEQSIADLINNDYDRQPKSRIIKDTIVEGKDELGVALFGDDFGFWYGSVLDINRTRTITPNQNATTLQVAASVLGAIVYLGKHPSLGVVLPDWLDHEEILKIADPFIKPIVGQYFRWRPEGEGDLLFTDFLEKSGETDAVQLDHML